MDEREHISLAKLPQPIKMHIEHLERVRRDFVANVSHELRTPLTVIRGYLEILLMQTSKSIAHTQSNQKILQQMYQHSVRMESLVEDLLLLSHLESDEMLPRSDIQIKVADILKTLVEDAKSISGKRRHSITLIADKNLMLKGVESELKSLFSNLIINAVKYTPAKGRIVIEWFHAKGQAVFKVTDTGIGIAKKHIPRLTERFYRVDKARSRESGGTGLGLAIVKHVLIRHEGDIEIESQLGKGSTFVCRFPKKRSLVMKLS